MARKHSTAIPGQPGRVLSARSAWRRRNTLTGTPPRYGYKSPAVSDISLVRVLARTCGAGENAGQCIEGGGHDSVVSPFATLRPFEQTGINENL